MPLLVGLLALLHGTITADSVRLVGSTLMIEPLAVSVALPPEWFGAKDTVSRLGGCGHVVHGPAERRLAISRPNLDSALDATGEWDREYSAVTDSILPFRDLLAQLGPEPFGRGSCFTDLQFRVYVTELAPDEITRRAAAIGVATARGFFPSGAIVSRDSADWHIDRVHWNAWYSDYGTEANVEIFTTTVRGRTLALVFMRATFLGAPAERDQAFILSHIKV